jgi:hypothetical protein
MADFARVSRNSATGIPFAFYVHRAQRGDALTVTH